MKRELSAAMLREMQFPVPLVTISGVDLTPDLKKAHVFVSAIGSEQQRAEVLRLLQDRRILLQSEIAKRVIIKHTPQLHFHLDESIERGTRVLSIMDELGMEIGAKPTTENDSK